MKKLTIETGISLLSDIINGDKRHRDYDRVVELAKLMKQLITGENMDDLMRRFTRRESDELFEQRVEITQPITSTVSRNLMKPAYKIPRSNGVRRILKYTDDDENKKLNEFEIILSKFWGTKSLDKYLGKRWVDLTYLDPNSFIVYEWKSFDEGKEHAQPYPFEVSSEEAIYYQFINNILQFLVVKNDFEYGAGDIPERVQEPSDKIPTAETTSRYTIYFEGYSIVLEQLTEKEKKDVKPGESSDEWEEGMDYVTLKNDIYRVSIFKSELDFIPVVRVGFEYDPMTRARTCVSPMHEAVPLLMKTIKANSELDLTMSLHAHPQKIQYVRACQAENCNQGRLPSGGGKCKTCKGTGRESVSTTAQEVIELVMPRDKEDMVTLDNIVRYEAPPVDLVKFQSDYIRVLTEQCIEAVYNSQVFSRKQSMETATKSNIDHENVYDSLYPMAEAYADTWNASIGAISKITDKDKGLIYSFIINKDFKMKTMSELINDLKVASDSRAESFVKEGIQDDIAISQYTDDPTGLSRYRTKKFFNPYGGKTTEEKGMILATVPPNDFHATLWEMYGYIFEELEMEYRKRNINFYDLKPAKQWTAIEKKVNKKIKDREGLEPTIKVEEDETIK